MEMGADMSKFACCRNASQEASGRWLIAESGLRSSGRSPAAVLALGYRSARLVTHPRRLPSAYEDVGSHMEMIMNGLGKGYGHAIIPALRQEESHECEASLSYKERLCLNTYLPSL